MLEVFFILFFVCFIAFWIIENNIYLLAISIVLLLSCIVIIVTNWRASDIEECKHIQEQGFNVIQRGVSCYVETSTGLYFKNGTNKYYTKEDVMKK